MDDGSPFHAFKDRSATVRRGLRPRCEVLLLSAGEALSS